MYSWMPAVISGAEKTIVVDLFIILASASVVALLMQRAKLAVVPAYLITGALVGPYGFGLVQTDQTLAEISHLAIILLLFGIGLELNLAVLRHNLARMILIGTASCIISVLMGWPVAAMFRLPAPAALAVSMALALSSTAVVMRIISQRRELQRTSGRLALAILVIQDLIVLIMLALLPALAGWSSGTGNIALDSGTTSDLRDSWLHFAFDAVLRIGGIAVLIVAGKYLLPRILRESFRERSLEVMMIVGVASAFAAAIATHAMGFSLEMGAFLAGFILAGTPFRHQLGGQIGSLRDLFIALFFTTVGMKLDSSILLEWWWVIFLGAFIIIVLKATVIAGTCWSFGATATIAITVGLSLAQAGEFSLILLDAAHGQEIIGDTAIASLIAIVVISLVLTPALIGVGNRISPLFSNVGLASWTKSATLGDPPVTRPETAEESRHAVIGGYGPIGRLLADELEGVGFTITVVDLNPRTVQQESRLGKSIIFGDVANHDVLESAGISRADALILTMPDERAILRACTIVRERFPNIFIASRTGTISAKKTLEKTGIDHITVEEMTAADDMLRAVMNHVSQDEEYK